jgi:hypothetical protein
VRVAVILTALVLTLAAAPAAAARSFHGDGTRVSSASAVLAASSPAPCNDSKYSFIGPSSAWASTLGWRFRTSSTPGGLSSSDVLATLKKAFKNITNSRNDCGLADEVSATSSYLGTTSRKPGVSAAGGCTGTDGYSVIGFAPLDDYYAGYTCIWWNGSNQIYEMDMRLDPNQPWALSLASCSNELMMEALATHEVGHAFGLGHVSEAKHGRETMSVYIDGLCENQESTLGLGDVLGLRSLY